jgi:transcription-repair coupling factor (superfamily II helicase)
MIDRFGPPPPLAEALLRMARLRIAAHRWGIQSMHLENRYVVSHYTDARLIRQLAAENQGRLRVVDGRSAYLPLDEGVVEPEEILAAVESLLSA